MAKKTKHKIKFGEFSEHIGKEEHELIDEEVELLKKDYRGLKELEKEVKSEEDIIKDFEKKIQSLLKTMTYLEGYISKIEEGDTMLKKHPSVEKLGNELGERIKEVEVITKSLTEEEEKALGLAKHVKKVLSKAREYQKMIFD